MVPGATARYVSATALAHSVIEAFHGLDQDILIQKFIREAQGADIRALVVGRKVVAAMKRQGKSWITNVSQGGTCAPADLSGLEDLRVLAQKACRALQMDYAGVDLIRDREGRTHVVEVNGIPAWKGLQSVSRVNIAQRLVDDFLDRYLQRSVLHSVA